MAERDSVKRRDFIRAVGGALLAVPLVAQVVSCAEEAGQYPPAGSGPGAGGGGGGGNVDRSFAVMNSDASGHSHSFLVSCSDEGADSVSYIADGAHTHEVVLSRSQLAAIFDGGQVTIETSDGHPHTWVIKMPTTACAASSPPDQPGGDDGGW